MNKKALIDEEDYKPGLFTFKAKSYPWLIERLHPAKLGRRDIPLVGCKLNLPDIAVFKGGKIKFVALTNV